MLTQCFHGYCRLIITITVWTIMLFICCFCLPALRRLFVQSAGDVEVCKVDLFESAVVAEISFCLQQKAVMKPSLCLYPENKLICASQM